jgi:hypothetical protein
VCFVYAEARGNSLKVHRKATWQNDRKDCQ